MRKKLKYDYGGPSLPQQVTRDNTFISPVLPTALVIPPVVMPPAPTPFPYLGASMGGGTNKMKSTNKIYEKAKGGYLGQPESELYGEALGSTMGTVANYFVPGAGAVASGLSAFNKGVGSAIDRLGNTPGDTALGTAARREYDNKVDNGFANVLRNFESIPGLGGLQASVMGSTLDFFSRKKHKEIPAVAGYEHGGDLSLSSDSTLIQGNPNQVDGNRYGNVALDHDEVVKGNFVFSNRLINPLTNESFAKGAQKIEKATGRLERRAASFPHDLITRNTIRENEMSTAKLRDSQERLATQLGLRNDDGSTVQSAAKGGYLKYGPGGPVMGTPQWFGNLANSGVGASFPNYASSTYVDATVNPYTGQPVLSSHDIPYTYSGKVGDMSNFQQLPSRRPSYVTTPIGPYAPDIGEEVTMYPAEDRISSLNTSPRSVDKFANNFPLPTNAPSSFLRSDWTAGDTLQAMSTLSMFRELGKPYEKAPLYQDRTPISRNYIRPDAQLLSNANNYNQAVRSVDTNSANTFNSLQANLLSSKFRADNEVLSNTQQANRSTNQQYEQALSNRLRYNQAQAAQRDIMNSQNKAAYDQALQAAFTSVGNFGKGLNEKKASKDAIKMLSQIFPQVYQGVFSEKKKYGGALNSLFSSGN